MVSLLGSGLTGARCYIGSQNLTFKHPEHSKDGECRPDCRSAFADGVVTGNVNISFDCNGKTGWSWMFFVSYEPDDTFTVRLLARRGQTVKMLAEHRDIYIDSLKETVESSYDAAINEHCQGFIPC